MGEVRIISLSPLSSGSANSNPEINCELMLPGTLNTPALKRQTVIIVKRNAFVRKNVVVQSYRACNKASASDKFCVYTACRGNGYKKPKRAAAFNAVERCGLVLENVSSVNGKYIFFYACFGSKRLNTTDRRLDVI